MKWVKDNTGRFPRRPHYLPEELDLECEATITTFLKQRHSRVEYPISTDDLTVLVETMVDDLDLYADLSKEAGEVEGVTDFVPGRRPKVRISERLSNDLRVANRFRTTLTHELGHLQFHGCMFELGKSESPLIASVSVPVSNKCKRDKILHAGQSDWMEWQAGYCCGSFLMPLDALRQATRTFIADKNATIAQFSLSSPEAEELIDRVCCTFQVSQDAARVRLLQRGVLVERELPPTLF